MVTDCHYADAGTAGSRYYRQSLDKLAECVELMNAQKVDFLIELGDIKDQNNPPVEQKTFSYLQTVESVFRRFKGPTYHVLGNHDMDSISKEQFLSVVENTNVDSSRSYYSFDLKGLHFAVLDANYTAQGADYDHGNFNWTDANIPTGQLNWLRQDLVSADGHVIVFVHQLLDGSGSAHVRNAQHVRRILEESDKVLAVFQGHHHEGAYQRIGRIHYYTLRALVEGPAPVNNSYAVVEILPGADIIVSGYRNAATRRLARPGAAVTS